MDNTIITNTQSIQENFPFLSCIKWQDKELVGIIQNTTDKTMTFYNMERIGDEDDRLRFVEYGNIWWNESNRLLPINIFLRDAMKYYQPTLQTFKLKETEVLFGPVTSLQNLLSKRIKRSQIQLVVKKT